MRAATFVLLGVSLIMLAMAILTARASEPTRGEATQGMTCHMAGHCCGMTLAGAAHGDDSAASSAADFGGQKTCPVTGKALGTMGKPVAVEVKGQTIYVCCKGCVAKVKADPDTYLEKVKKEIEKKS